MTLKNYLITAAFAAVIVLTVVFAPSCANTNREPPKTIGPHIAHTEKDLRLNADDIDRHLVEARKVTPGKLIPVLSPHYDGISDANDRNRLLADDLANTQRDVKLYEEAYAKTQAALKKAQADRDDALKKKLHGLVVLSIIGIAVSGALLFSGNKLGLAGGVGCAILLAVSLLIGQTVGLIVWIVGGIVVIAVVLTVVIFIQKNRSLFAAKATNTTLDAAVTETVKTLEAMKPLLPEDVRRHVFDRGIATEIQSHGTQKLVASKRSVVGKAQPLAPKQPKPVAKRKSSGRQHAIPIPELRGAEEA